MSSDQFCRLCLKQDLRYHNILENGIDEMLDSLTNIKISKDETAPTVACTPCIELLKTAYQIQQKIINANNSLEDRIKNPPPKKPRRKPAMQSTPTEPVVILEESDQVLDLTLDDDDSQIKVDKEESKSYPCQFCGYRFKTEGEMAWHRYKVHSLRRMKLPSLNKPPPLLYRMKSSQHEKQDKIEETNLAMKTAVIETREFLELLIHDVPDEDTDQSKFRPSILNKKRKLSSELKSGDCSNN